MTWRGGAGLSRRGFLAAGAAVVARCALPAPTGSAAASGRATIPSGGATGSSAPAAGAPAVELVHATSGRREVALTFHGAGDPDLAGRVLAGFADRGAAVTVLTIGTWLAQYRTWRSWSLTTATSWATTRGLIPTCRRWTPRGCGPRSSAAATGWSR